MPPSFSHIITLSTHFHRQPDLWADSHYGNNRTSRTIVRCQNYWSSLLTNCIIDGQNLFGYKIHTTTHSLPQLILHIDTSCRHQLYRAYAYEGKGTKSITVRQYTWICDYFFLLLLTFHI